jgi:hypothetical protein
MNKILITGGARNGKVIILMGIKEKKQNIENFKRA